MEYAAPTWDPYRVKDINKLEMVQRRCSTFFQIRLSSYNLLDDLGWRTLSDRRKDARLTLFGKAVCVCVCDKVAIPVVKLKQPTKVARFF